MNVSLCTTCMGRLYHLAETLPCTVENVAQLTNVEIVVLGYNSPDGLSGYMSQYRRSPVVKYYAERTVETFFMAHAKNVAHRLGMGDILISVDADTTVTREWIETAVELISQGGYQTIVRSKETPGRLAITRQRFYEMGGYDESLSEGWGYEDCDLFYRSQAAGGAVHWLDLPVYVIRHSDAERSRYHRTTRLSLEQCWRAHKEQSDANIAHGNLTANEGRTWGAATVYRNDNSLERVILGPIEQIHAAAQTRQAPRRDLTKQHYVDETVATASVLTAAPAAMAMMIEDRPAPINKRRNGSAKSVFTDSAWWACGYEWDDQAAYCRKDYESWKKSIVEHFVRPKIDSDSVYLEIGAGLGRWASQVIGTPKHMWLVEPDPVALGELASRYESSTVSCIGNDGATFPCVPDESVDFVWSYDVFVHLPADVLESYLREIVRVLKPGKCATLHYGTKASPPGTRTRTDLSVLPSLAERVGLRVLGTVDEWGDGYNCQLFRDKITTVEKPPALVARASAPRIVVPPAHVHEATSELTVPDARPSSAHEHTEPARTNAPIPVKIYGLQRTGTNLVEAQIRRNFNVRYLEESGTGWKHGVLCDASLSHEGIPTRFVLCVKDPYAWLVSCYRYFCRDHAIDTTMPPDFKRDPTVSFDEFVMMPSYEFETPVHRWNFMYRCWLMTLPKERTVAIRQEDQLLDQVAVLENLRLHLAFEQINESLEPIREQVDVDGSIRGSIKRDYYLDREYLMDFSPSLLSFVNRLLDTGVMEVFGYQKERWCLARRTVEGVTMAVRPCSSDAADVREITSDPYGYEQVRAADSDIECIVDVGAHVGATVILAKRVWPDCKVVAYEASADNFRLLRLNARGLARVELVNAALLDETGRDVPFLAADDGNPEFDTAHGRVSPCGGRKVSGLGVNDAFGQLGRIDFLKIGSADVVLVLLKSLAASGLMRGIRWIAGRVADSETRNRLRRLLEPSHRVEMRSQKYGETFIAQRV